MALDPPIGFADLDKLPTPSQYRVLILDPESRVTRMVPIFARDDDDAERMARMFVDGHAVELWDGVRFMEHFKSVEPHPEDEPIDAAALDR